MKKKIAILGSTGSIGQSTLEVIRKDKKNFNIILLSANNNYKKLVEQAKQFKVKNVLIKNHKFYLNVKNSLKRTKTKVYSGDISIKRIISKKSKPLIVAEIGINHFGSLKLAKRIVDSAKKSGAEAVKVQIHLPDEEMSEEAKRIKPGNSNTSIYKIITRNSLSLKEEKELKKYIEKKKLIYIATPFSYKAAKWLNDNNLKVFKIGSGECNNIPFIKYICSFNKPMIISTGMNNLETVKKTVRIVKKNKIPHAILHCINLYPTDYKYIRLGRLNKMNKIFKNRYLEIT